MNDMKEKKEIVIHYDELALKGENRILFEKTMMRRLEEQMRDEGFSHVNVKRQWGRIFIRGEWRDEDEERIRERLLLTPGIANFGFVLRIPREKDSLLTEGVPFILKRVGRSSFRITAKRVDKSFPLNSREVEILLGTELFKHSEELNVDLKKYEKEVVVKILQTEILIFVKERGIGGLPVGSSGNAVSLISAGFDSPVASFLLMKRGVKVHPIHFHASEMVGEEAVKAVEDIVSQLSRVQGKTKLALVPVLPIQKYIAENAPNKLRIVLIRRVFMRLASRYAELSSSLALITGESVGQVASQTLENIRTIGEASRLPILRPLSGMNKNEIIAIARKIGTAEISARPCEDTCSLFLPDYPETKSRLKEVLNVERNLEKLPEMEEKALQSLDIRIFPL